MQIFIHVKQLGSRKIRAVPYELPYVPRTLRQLIDLTARQEARRYNERLQKGGPVRSLTDADIAAQAAVGKVAFGLPFGDTPADEDEAARCALSAFEDGLVRIFRNDAELTDLLAPLDLSEGDTLTFLRLAMLAGSPFHFI